MLDVILILLGCQKTQRSSLYSPRQQVAIIAPICYGEFMRATVDLPDDLFIAVKKCALEMHLPMRALIESAIRRELGELQLAPKEKPKKKIRWVTSSAESPDFDLSSREAMYQWFERQKT